MINVDFLTDEKRSEKYYEIITSPFMQCCVNGHLKMAQWLIMLGENGYGKIKINYCNDYTFRSCCKNGHLEIASG